MHAHGRAHLVVGGHAGFGTLLRQLEKIAPRWLYHHLYLIGKTIVDTLQQRIYNPGAYGGCTHPRKSQ